MVWPIWGQGGAPALAAPVEDREVFPGPSLGERLDRALESRDASPVAGVDGCVTFLCSIEQARLHVMALRNEETSARYTNPGLARALKAEGNRAERKLLAALASTVEEFPLPADVT